MKWLIIVVAFLIGVGAGVAYVKSLPAAPTPILVRVGGLSQQALLNPHPGDIIKWQDGAGGPVAIDWDFGVSPCDPNAAFPKSECHILAGADHKTYAYECPQTKPCDPEVPVGSDVSNNGQQGALTAGRPPEQIFIGCDAGSGKVATKPDPAKVSQSVQGAAYWKGVAQATTWTIDTWKDGSGHPATVCHEATVNQGQPVCTVTAAPGTYTYQVTASACTTPAGTFTLQVNQ